MRSPPKYSSLLRCTNDMRDSWTDGLRYLEGNEVFCYRPGVYALNSDFVVEIRTLMRPSTYDLQENDLKGYVTLNPLTPKVLSDGSFCEVGGMSALCLMYKYGQRELIPKGTCSYRCQDIDHRRLIIGR